MSWLALLFLRLLHALLPARALGMLGNWLGMLLSLLFRVSGRAARGRQGGPTVGRLLAGCTPGLGAGQQRCVLGWAARGAPSPACQRLADTCCPCPPAAPPTLLPPHHCALQRGPRSSTI